MATTQQSDQKPTTALSNIRVLDLGRVLSGPFCTQILGDMGAEIIKIEHPERGDDTRAWTPPEVAGESPYFWAINRNKKSVTLDLSMPEGKKILHDLAKECDVMLENFRPGVAARLGVDYETMAAINPKLVYCSISGYGQEGPMSRRAAYDYILQAMSGVMSLTGERDGGPFRCAGAITDYGSGLWATIAVLFAIMERGRTGRGQHIDISMLDCTMPYISHVMSMYLADNVPPNRLGNGHEKIVPMNVYETADSPLMVLCGNDGMFKRLVKAVDRPDMAEDPKFTTIPDRAANLGELEANMREAMLTDTRENWMKRLTEADIPFAPVRDVAEVLAADELKARDMVLEIEHPTAGPIRVLGSPLKLSESPVAKNPTPPPLLGEHTEAVLGEVLSMGPEEFAALRKVGAIR